MKRIADHIADYMRHEGMTSICWGDAALVNAARDHIQGRAGSHPLNVMTAACNAISSPTAEKGISSRPG